MTRLFPVILFVSSCAQFTIQDYKSVYQSVFIKNNGFPITQEYIDSKKYSFAKFQIGNREPAILTLVSINRDLYTWISAAGEKITTRHGKIVQTFGLDHDISILDHNELTYFKSNSKVLIKLESPTALIEKNISFMASNSKKFAASYKNGQLVRVFEEHFESKKIRWKGVNLYWVDSETNLVLRSRQEIHPYEDTINIEFYYK